MNNSKIKIAFGMIVFEGDYFLKEVLEQVYPHASQILIAEGPVKFFQNLGRSSSTDNTNIILDQFPDPESKIKVIHGKFSEKDEQCSAYMKLLNEDIDYLWNLDSDECYRTDDLIKIIEFLQEENPSSVGIRSLSFFGGFNHTLTGFELHRDNFLRIFRVTPGAKWKTHRPPTIIYEPSKTPKLKHISSEALWEELEVQMYHYSYVYPRQVFRKVQYYKAAVSREKCIDNYFISVFMPWVLGDKEKRAALEAHYLGVHEYKPEYRGPCFTQDFMGIHPESIARSYENMNNRLSIEISMMERNFFEFKQFCS